MLLLDCSDIISWLATCFWFESCFLLVVEGTGGLVFGVVMDGC